MAEIATIARPYADALFQATQSDLVGTQTWLQAFAAVAADPDLQAFASNPNSTASQVKEVLVSAAKIAPNSAASNFLTAVLDNGRLAALPEIASQYQLLKNASQGIHDAVIYSAFPIEPAALADLETALNKRFSRKLKCVVEMDTSLIGGVRVVVGDEVLDASVRARLDQMKATLVA
jgi:F-type H+-transporting ATPase subunit delta